MKVIDKDSLKDGVIWTGLYIGGFLLLVYLATHVRTMDQGGKIAAAFIGLSLAACLLSLAWFGVRDLVENTVERIRKNARRGWGHPGDFRRALDAEKRLESLLSVAESTIEKMKLERSSLLSELQSFEAQAAATQHTLQRQEEAWRTSAEKLRRERDVIHARLIDAEAHLHPLLTGVTEAEEDLQRRDEQLRALEAELATQERERAAQERAKEERRRAAVDGLGAFDAADYQRCTAEELVALAHAIFTKLEPHLPFTTKTFTKEQHLLCWEFKECMDALAPFGFHPSPFETRGSGDELRRWMCEMKEWLDRLANTQPPVSEVDAFRHKLNESHIAFTVMDAYFRKNDEIKQRKDLHDYEKLAYLDAFGKVLKEWCPPTVPNDWIDKGT